jgi:hypothetical protein
LDEKIAYALAGGKCDLAISTRSMAKSRHSKINALDEKIKWKR